MRYWLNLIAGFFVGLFVCAASVEIGSQSMLDEVISKDLDTYTDEVECVKDTSKPCDLVMIKIYKPIN